MYGHGYDLQLYYIAALRVWVMCIFFALEVHVSIVLLFCLLTGILEEPFSFLLGVQNDVN